MVSAHDRLAEAKMTRYACKSRDWKKKEKSCDVHMRAKVVDFGWMMVMVMTNWLLLSSTLPTLPYMHQ